MFKKSVVAAVVLSAAATAWAEPQRALFTHENKFPEVGQFEVGGFFDYKEFDSRDEEALVPYARYGIIENLTLNAAVPIRWINPEDGNDESGFGDIQIGAELLAYEDIFRYPYVIPHIDLAFPTGDSDEGLGTGDAVTTFGISIGTVVYDVLHYVADLSYAINGGQEQPDPDNVVIFSGSIIWDVSKRFAVLVEGRATDEDNPKDDIPAIFEGGMVYKFTENLVIGWYGGAGRSGVDNPDTIARLKVAYTF